MKQDLLNKKNFWKSYEVRSERGTSIDADSGLLGMYFDAVVVEVEKYLLFSNLLWPYCALFDAYQN